MARRKKNNQSNNTKNVNENIDPVAEKIDHLQSELKITDEELESQEVEINTTQLKVRNIESTFKKATQIVKSLEEKEKKLQANISKLDEKDKELDSEKENLTAKIEHYDRELKEINELRVGNFVNIIDKKVIDNYAKSLEEQKNILISEIEKLKHEQTKYIELILKKENEISGEKQELVLEIERLKQDSKSLFKVEKEQLDTDLKDIDNQRKKLTNDQDDFKDKKIFLEQKERKEFEAKISELEQDKKLLDELNTQLQVKIDGLQDIYRYFGNTNPKNAKDELDSAKKEIYDLRSKLELNPSSLDVAELDRLKKEKVDWESQLQDIAATANEYRRRYELEKISVGEKETLEFEKEELEKRIELQKVALEEFKKVLVESEADEVFQSCIGMDKEYNIIDDLAYINDKISGEWLDILQQVFADKIVPLYYDKDTLRSFVAGLAMSRLNILQGISGTGKTSLPVAFAEAIGGHPEIIEVQSGWKDRQDLIGYYNTFEKKFYESDFLKALYKANTPKYRNKPFFIILDEMNLSHPEHYFADLLSIMEKTNQNDQKLKISDKVSGMPELMTEEDGTYKLHIPDNVWFIGTANHDETTVQFAPKTYDRAGVIEMPKSHHFVEVDDDLDSDFIFIENQKLLNNFNSVEDVSHCLEYLNETSFQEVCDKLGIGWGNRLDKQIRKFVPIFKQLGGSEADAMDHIISSKILQKIRGRYDLQSVTLEEMRNELSKNFVDFFKKKPLKSISIVIEELEKK